MKKATFTMRFALAHDNDVCSCKIKRKSDQQYNFIMQLNNKKEDPQKLNTLKLTTYKNCKIMETGNKICFADLTSFADLSTKARLEQNKMEC
jgi:hypothetical protein